jgi:hypothetical protein
LHAVTVPLPACQIARFNGKKIDPVLFITIESSDRSHVDTILARAPARKPTMMLVRGKRTMGPSSVHDRS